MESKETTKMFDALKEDTDIETWHRIMYSRTICLQTGRASLDQFTDAAINELSMYNNCDMRAMCYEWMINKPEL